MKILFSTLILLVPTVAFSHAKLISPTPRSTSSGIKTGPCGGLPRGTTPMTLTPGQALTVQWEETINHPGRYYISFSPANDAGFEMNRLATIVDTQDTPVAGVSHKYSATITVPTTPCENCTLQLIQSMEENPAAPTFYYSCADIRIAGAATPTPAPTTPTPSSSGTPSQDLNSMTSSKAELTKVGGGCGTVTTKETQSPLNGLIFLLPVFIWGFLLTIVRRQKPVRVL